MRRHSAKTLIEVFIAVVVAALIGLLVFAVIVPARGGRRGPRNQMITSTRLRSIHQSTVIYANNNNSYLPGLDASGELIDASTRGRFQILLDGGYFTGELLLHPNDPGAVEWKSGRLRPSNYSYAALEINGESRRDEWRDLANSLAPMFSDRAIGPDAQGAYRSLWTLNEPDATAGWRGSLVWGDNHAEFIQSHLVNTRFGEQTNTLDNLFLSEMPGGADAWMVR